jgi:hypothetical protein
LLGRQRRNRVLDVAQDYRAAAPREDRGHEYDPPAEIREPDRAPCVIVELEFGCQEIRPQMPFENLALGSGWGRLYRM